MWEHISLAVSSFKSNKPKPHQEFFVSERQIKLRIDFLWENSVLFCFFFPNEQLSRAFEKVPGFKEIRVLGFRWAGCETHISYIFPLNLPIRINSEIREFCIRVSECLLLTLALSISLEDTSVRYAVVFNGETELGDDPEVLQEPDEEQDEDANAPKLKHIIVKALKQDPLLPLDIQTLSFEAGEHHLHVFKEGIWL